MVMLFGQCNAPATFQHVMDRILRPLKLKYPYVMRRLARGLSYLR